MREKGIIIQDIDGKLGSYKFVNEMCKVAYYNDSDLGKFPEIRAEYIQVKSHSIIIFDIRYRRLF